MKLSIITINKNNSSGLEKTILSVINQTYKDFEYIIIDGNSTDKSVEIIKKYSTGINYWVSELDTGIYNAMNKGIRKAQGEYCLFLNSGDWLIDETTLIKLFDEITYTEEAGIYYTDRIATNHTHFQPPKKIDINFLIVDCLCHQNTLIKRSLFLEHGFYNERFRIASDYAFWLREFWTFKTKFVYIKTNIAIYDSFGISTLANHNSELKEIFLSVFGDLGEPLVKLHFYTHSVYGSIVETYGYPKLLNFFNKVYKISRRFYSLTQKEGFFNAMKFCFSNFNYYIKFLKNKV
jgi:glycosyltransferase involved in cell wall biosynthesis